MCMCDGGDDAQVRPNMLCLDNNVIIYVNVVICLMVVTSIGAILPPHCS